MNIEMLEIYRSMIDSTELNQEDAELLKKNLEEEKRHIEEELEKFYDDEGMIKHSKEINIRENIIDELRNMISRVQDILQDLCDQELEEASALAEVSVDLSQVPSEEDRTIAIAIIQERRKNIGTIANALKIAEAQARALVQKIQEPKPQDKDLSQTQEYEKDEKVR